MGQRGRPWSRNKMNVQIDSLEVQVNKQLGVSRPRVTAVQELAPLPHSNKVLGSNPKEFACSPCVSMGSRHRLLLDTGVSCPTCHQGQWWRGRLRADILAGLRSSGAQIWTLLPNLSGGEGEVSLRWGVSEKRKRNSRVSHMTRRPLSPEVNSD